MSDDLIGNFVHDVCFALGIEAPIVSRDTVEIRYSEDANTIFIPETDTLDLELLYAVAYQLRIRWQFSTNPEYYNHQAIDEIENDNSISEIDANAFAALYMISYLNLMCKFSAISPCIRELILNRMNAILDE